jgi:hypothetical protein
MTPIQEQEDSFKGPSKATIGEDIYPPEIAAARDRIRRRLRELHPEEYPENEEPAEETPLIQTSSSDSDVLMLNAAADAADYVLLGAVKIAKGITKLGDWMASMRGSGIDIPDAEMEQLFNESKAFDAGEELPAAETPLKTNISAVTSMKVNNVIIGATYIAEGVTKFADWVTSMRSSDVNLTEAEMEQLFKEAKAFHDDEELPSAEEAPLIQTNISDSDMIIRNAAADAADTVFIGALKIAKGITKFADWALSMKESDPEIPDDQMEQLFKQSQAMQDGEELPAAEMPLKTRKAKAPAIDKVKAIAADEEQLDSRTVYELVVEKMKAHSMASPNPAKAEMTDADFNSICKEVTTEVKAYFPDITEREVRDLFAGYGIILQKEKLSEQVRQLSACLEVAKSIVDANAKIAQLQPGPQRDKAIQAVRRLRKKLAREDRMIGLDHAAGSPGS